MSTQPAHDPQRERTMDLFAAFAKSIFPNSMSGVTAARGTLYTLLDIDNPRAAEVLDAIHAERRRRQSAATRAERRNA